MPHGLERIFSPSMFDIVFPFFAFFLVIVMPFFFGVFVLIQVLSGRYSGEDRRR